MPRWFWGLKHIYTVLCVCVCGCVCGCGCGCSSGDEALELELFGAPEPLTIEERFGALEIQVARLLRSQSEGQRAVNTAITALHEALDIGRQDATPADDMLCDVLEQVRSALHALDPEGEGPDDMTDSA